MKSFGIFMKVCFNFGFSLYVQLLKRFDRRRITGASLYHQDVYSRRNDEKVNNWSVLFCQASYLIVEQSNYSYSTIHSSKRGRYRTHSFTEMETICGEQSQECFSSRRAKTTHPFLVQTSSNWKSRKKRSDRRTMVKCIIFTLECIDSHLLMLGR